MNTLQRLSVVSPGYLWLPGNTTWVNCSRIIERIIKLWCPVVSIVTECYPCAGIEFVQLTIACGVSFSVSDGDLFHYT